MGCTWSLVSPRKGLKTSSARREPSLPSNEDPANTNANVAPVVNQTSRSEFAPDLVERLYEAMITSPIDGRRFIPIDQLDELITEEAIKSELVKAKIRGGATPHLLKYVLEHARKIFAILVMIEDSELIEGILLEGLMDTHLPLGFDRSHRGRDSGPKRVVRSYNLNSDTLDMSTNWAVFQSLKPHRIERFCLYQWMFLAPVFTGGDFRYFLHRDCPMPYVDLPASMEETRFSHHSQVFKVCIHKAHFQAVDSEGPYIAVKELHLNNPSEYNAEAMTLAKLSRLTHPHLIKCLATYQQAGKYCFMFQWAEGGNLRQFWANQDRVSRNMELMTWALLQMRGLAEGLKILHNYSGRENCRHGDLKPENILRFISPGGLELGQLVMTDLGSATFHAEETQSRGRGTGAGYGTIRYEPPEALWGRMKPRSRRYDVWSIGCIFLEFSIWLLYGWDELESFNEGLDRYWLNEGSSARVHPKVLACIERMHSDPRCQGESALGDLLKAIERRLLVPEDGKADSELGSADITTSTAVSDRSEDIDEPEGGGSQIRADSRELDKVLGKMVKKMERILSYAFDESSWGDAKGRRLVVGIGAEPY